MGQGQFRARCADDTVVSFRTNGGPDGAERLLNIDSKALDCKPLFIVVLYDLRYANIRHIGQNIFGDNTQTIVEAVSFDDPVGIRSGNQMAEIHGSLSGFHMEVGGVILLEFTTGGGNAHAVVQIPERRVAVAFVIVLDGGISLYARSEKLCIREEKITAQSAVRITQ